MRDESERSASYSAEWDDLALRIRSFFAVWIGGFLLGAAAIHFLPGAAIVFFALWAIAFFVAGSRWSSFPCPRCQEPFFKPNSWSVNQFLTRCPHCGLAKQ